MAKNTAKEKMDRAVKITSPTSFGPGVWFSIHTFAKHAITQEKKEQFVEFIHIITESLRCSACRAHAVQYVEEHPFEPYWNLQSPHGEEIGMFRWSWMFQNAVNARIGKPELSWEEAYNLYYRRGAIDVPSAACPYGCPAQSPPNGRDFAASSSSPRSGRTQSIRGGSPPRAYGALGFDPRPYATSSRTQRLKNRHF